MQDMRFHVEQRVSKALWDPCGRQSVVLSETDGLIDLPEGAESESAARLRQLDAMLNPAVTSETGESAAAEHLRRLEALLNGDDSAALVEAVSVDARVENQAAWLGELDARLAPVEGDAAAMIEPSQATVEDALGHGHPRVASPRDGTA